MFTIQAEDIVLLQQLLLQIQKHSVVLEHISLMKLLQEKDLRLKQELKKWDSDTKFLKYPMSELEQLNFILCRRNYCWKRSGAEYPLQSFNQDDIYNEYTEK